MLRCHRGYLGYVSTTCPPSGLVPQSVEHRWSEHGRRRVESQRGVFTSCDYHSLLVQRSIRGSQWLHSLQHFNLTADLILLFLSRLSFHFKTRSPLLCWRGTYNFVLSMMRSPGLASLVRLFNSQIPFPITWFMLWHLTSLSHAFRQWRDVCTFRVLKTCRLSAMR